MISIRKAKDRGLTSFDWLKSYHTFSFGSYFDRNFMGFGSLRVINDDVVAPGQGFGEHPHDNMEILTYILKGALKHQDTMGNTSIIQRGDVQRMSAGTGVRHSEYNASTTEEVHLLQIWILPAQEEMAPSYEQKNFKDEEKSGRFKLIASPEGRNGSVTLHQNVDIYAGVLNQQEPLSFTFEPGQRCWVHVAKGDVMLNETPLQAGDGAGVVEEKQLEFKGAKEAEILLFVIKEN
jgi:redox-sensitive bicupin YhaK (pirin superfamily)